MTLARRWRNRVPRSRPLATVALCGVALALSAAEPAPVCRAVLIGINEYRTDEFMDLRGAVNDVETIQKILTTRFGFSREHISVLTDGEATRAAILAVLEKLAEEAAPQDVVYIHFSGHGSQVKDLDGDEQDDGRDETILPHDARTAGVPDITDDELGEILGRLRAETAVIVLDSCHSGTATRGGLLTRSVPEDTRVELYRKPESEVTARAIVRLDTPERYVLLTGAASHQSALDGPLDGKFHGFFTFALARSLSAADVDVSPRDLHAGIQRVFESLSEEFGGLMLPEPQIEAAATVLDRSLFPTSGEAASTRPFLLVQPAGPGMARLLGGPALNAVAGSYWAIYPPGETEFVVGEAAARARVVRTDGNDSIAAIEPSDLQLKREGRAVAMAPPPASTRVPARWEGGDGALQQRLETEVRKHLPETDFVSADEFARFVVYVENGTCRVYGAAGLTVVDEFTLTSEDKAGERLAGLFSRSLKASSLATLTNPLSDIEIDVRLVGAGASNTLKTRKAGEARGHENSLMLEILVNRDSYITVVDVDAEGSVNILFPNSYSKEGFYPGGFVRAGDAMRIPDSLEPGNRAGFFWDCRPPTGMDTVQVFASTDLETAELIRKWIAGLPEVSDRGAPPDVASRGVSTELHRLDGLRNELIQGVQTRGFAVVADTETTAESNPEDPSSKSTEPRHDWNSTSLTIRIAG